MEIFETLDPLLKTFWYVAIPTTLIFTIQTAMTFLGTDALDGIGADFDGDFDTVDAPFQLFSLRNLINFLLGFSWSGISLFYSFSSPLVLLSVAVLIGLFFVYFFFFTITQLQKLAEDNSFQLSSALNKTAEVYLTIPEYKSGKGKILVHVNGSLRELDAITDQEKIPSGSLVRVLTIENNSLLLVETL
ncbi:NfeD family protein [Arundinibacter roseus]|uniref:Serine protease n=1 Tax=Arundinibacter roseus TaxID=2070510 RepID=A0A4R4KJU5_9BACT|nr:NfeD family protein [Arundinibacter roseus]TDB66889.1 serine protease [Arundinibacter roseus]